MENELVGTKIRATRRLQFCAGHRVLNHESKCANPHGHNYVGFFHAESETLDTLDTIGRVIDFSVLKEKIGGWIDDNWDHTFLVYDDDFEIKSMLEKGKWNKKPFISPFNPTAENMADYLLTYVCPKVLEGTGVKVTKVVLWETENCFAEAEI